MSDIEYKGDTEQEKQLNKEIFDCTLTIAQKDDEINDYKFAIKVKDNQIHELIDKLQQKENDFYKREEFLTNNIKRLEQEVLKRENIIKEVREKLKKLKIGSQEVENEWAVDICDIVLEILDKEVN